MNRTDNTPAEPELPADPDAGVTASTGAPSSGFDRRVLVLPVAALMIAMLCIWRATTPRGVSSVSGEVPDLKQPAPIFQLYDQSSTLVKLDAFLHRHTIALVFYDGKAGPEANATLRELREFYPALKREGVVVLGVSTALPQENRNNSTQPFPFPLLSDTDAVSPASAHQRWGRFVKPVSLDSPAGTDPAVFLIDRAGLVRWDIDTNSPRPEDAATRIVSQLLGAAAS